MNMIGRVNGNNFSPVSEHILVPNSGGLITAREDTHSDQARRALSSLLNGGVSGNIHNTPVALGFEQRVDGRDAWLSSAVTFAT